MFFAGCVLVAASLAQVLVYTRLNLYLGIPDRAFMLGETVIYSVIGQWMWIPGTVLMSQCCPSGKEATMYALVAGTINLGESLASFNGAFLLHCLGVVPTGGANEGNQFARLWQASLFSAALAMLMTTAMPLFIPNVSPGERLLPAGDSSVTRGSPWQRLKRRLKASDQSESEAFAPSHGQNVARV